MIEMKQKNKFETVRIKDSGIFLSYLIVIFHWSTLKILLKYLKTVLSDFFFLQYTVKLKLRNIPVVFVGNPLDDKIPYRPDKSDTYLDFIHFWIRPLSFIIKRFGVKRSLSYCAGFLSAIEDAYSQASKIYRFRMSTTTRPNHNNNKNMKIIHRVDPHYLCVPSLHIAVVTLTYTFFDDVFKKEGLSEEERKIYSKELYDGAIEIAETVLYVKQHSVNCIPAALYMMLQLQKEIFSIEKGVSFINNLFAKATDLSESDRNSVLNYIHYMFERLILEGCNEDDWTVPIKRWLLLQELKMTTVNKERIIESIV